MTLMTIWAMFLQFINWSFVLLLLPYSWSLVTLWLFGSFGSLTKICQCSPTIWGKVKSVQEACAKCFAVHILKFEIFQIAWKKLNKEHQILVFSFSSIELAFWCALFCFYMWFERFWISICEPQSISLCVDLGSE